MRTIILGFDAFDPVFFEGLLTKGQLPNLARYVASDGYRHFEVANPPQSEVSWTSIATGLNPGEHGIFDFVHRDPKSYIPYVSLLPTKRGLGGIQYVPPFTAGTFFDQAARKGFPAISLWWPATFPTRPDSLVKTIPGLGTPDILGKLGVGTYFSTAQDSSDRERKTPSETLTSNKKNQFQSFLKGPSRKKGDRDEASTLPLELEVLDDQQARLKIGNISLNLTLGKWSQIIELSFKMGTFVKIHALTRVILTSLSPEVDIYFLPLQINPLHSPWHYGTPPKFVKNVWDSSGSFLTIGWPQDTTGLEDGYINDQQFLDLCDSIFETRERIFIDQINGFTEGVLASVFDSLDRVQHMFWRDRADIIESWYIKLDGLVGRVEELIKKQGLDKTRLLILSDHGFTDFNQKVHLNRWLIDNGYLAAKGKNDSGKLADIDWTASKAYALGLNSIYLNLAGREGQGIVGADQVEQLTNQIKQDLTNWQKQDGNPVVKKVSSRAEALSGSLTDYGPDILVGYSPGYRASSETGLGEWKRDVLEANKDHWGADHCIDNESVPGVLFSNQGLGNFPNPSYPDMPLLAIGEDIEVGGSKPPPTMSDEDKDVLEERLKSLGYL
jgi:predicted AlkP superfamily phosphohydrolase/phosphomutase